MEVPDPEGEKIDRLRRAMYSRTLSEKLKDRPRRELNDSGAQVSDDFVRADEGVPGQIIAPRTIGLARTALWWILGAAILFFVAALLFFAYYFFLGNGSGSASSSNIDISVSGPPQVEGGVPTELQVSVANRNAVPLQLADIIVTYPSGTRSPTDFSTALPSQRISLGTIEAGGVRQGTVSAVLSGNAGDTADIKIELEYHLSGSSAIYVASSDYNALFSSSPLGIVVDGNQETISGQPVQLTVSVTSNTSAPVRDVVLQAQYPFGFTFSSATPPPSSDGFWQLGDLAAGQNKTVTILGSLSGAQSDSRVFHFNVGTRVNAASSSIDTSLASQIFTMSISQPFLGLAIAVNGASGSQVVVSPGDSVTVSIGWQNNLPNAITSAAIVARLTGLTIDGTTVKSTNGFYRSSDGVVLWDKTTDAELATVAPGAHGTVAFSFQVPSSDDLKGVVNPRLDISVNAAGNRLSETGVPQNLQATVDQKIAVASDLQVVAQGLYYSNPFSSTGPMPPKAGTETTYAIVLSVTNTTNKVTGASITATLPAYVRWVGIYSPNTENVTFNQNDSTVTWDMGDIAAGAGLNGTPPRQAAIAIGFTPSASQIGQQPALLQGITFTGTDASTGGAISRSPADVTTNILGDPGFSSANATVVK